MVAPGRLRVLSALRFICADGWPATLTEIAHGAGLSRTSTYQWLLALERDGLAKTNPRATDRRSGWRPAP